jgi:hypothetical protein
MVRAFEINANGVRIEMTRTARCLIVPFTFVAMILPSGQLFAQGAFPAPLPGRTGAPASSPVPLPPANAEAPSDACTKEFAHLREEAVERGELIKAASARHAPPDEACKLLGSYAQSETKMIKYLEANSANCGIPPQIGDQIRAGHKNTEAMRIKVCTAAARQARSPSEPPGPVGDFPQFDRRCPLGIPANAKLIAIFEQPVAFTQGTSCAGPPPATPSPTATSNQLDRRDDT